MTIPKKLHFHKKLWVVALTALILLVIAAPAQAHGSDQSLAPETVALNGIILVGLALSIGGLAFRTAVWSRTVGEAALEDRLTQMAFAGWFVLGVASVLALYVKSVLTGVPIIDVLFDANLRALAGTTFGMMWFVSLLLWGLFGAAIIRGSWATALFPGAIFSLTAQLYSHTPSPQDTLLVVATEWLFQLALALLIGALLGGMLTVIPSRRTNPRLLKVFVRYAAVILIAAGVTRFAVQQAQPTTLLSDAPTAQFYESRQSATLVVDLLIDPNYIGDNTFYVSVIDATSGLRLDDVQVRLSFSVPDSGAESEITLEGQGDGVYQAMAGNLNAPGVWQIGLSVERDNQTETFAFTVTTVLPP